MSAVMLRAERHVAFTAEECGSEFADATADVQAAFLLAWLYGTKKWCWPQQCEFIAAEIPKERRVEMAVMLGRITEYLEDGE